MASSCYVQDLSNSEAKAVYGAVFTHTLLYSALDANAYVRLMSGAALYLMTRTLPGDQLVCANLFKALATETPVQLLPVVVFSPC